ncbi:MAG: ABC transporter substrate-binding protein [Hyphomicrobiaceae bacterium]
MNFKCVAAVLASAVAVAGVVSPALAQKSGGILKGYHRGNPPSGSPLEEATISTIQQYMGVFNNLVIFDPDKRRESMETIIPELGTSWSWDDSKTKLTFKLRIDVKWHDGKPFTAKDVKCTFDLVLGKSKDRLRKNPRKIWYHNLTGVEVNGDYEATFVLTQPQPALLLMLASGYTPIYPCHVSAKDMRTNPIGTGPFKFVEFKRNEYIKFTKNKDYWKKGKPYLDGHEWRVITNRSTRILAFINGDFDITFDSDVTVPLLKDIKEKAPKAVCDFKSTGVSTNLIVNSTAPPFDNPKIRQAMALSLDRQSFIDILSEGKFQRGAAMLPGPDGAWGMPDEELDKLPGYGKDLEKNQAEARKVMEGLGYSDSNPLKVKVSTRNIAIYRDPAVILIDQLKKIHIAAELDVVDTSIWHAKVARKDYQVGLNLTGVGVDDPDVNFYENYACDSQRNYTKYCNKDLEKLFNEQSKEADKAKREKIVWEIEKRLVADVARPIIYHSKGATCWQGDVKDVTQHSNSIYISWRLEDVWLDR